MQHVFYFGIAIASLLSISSLCLLLMWKQIRTQTQMIQTLTNLAASKNLETFQRLQATNSMGSQSSNHLDVVESVNPLNDEALAAQMMKDYESRGIDPSLALSKTDDEWMMDFGGPEAFRTN